MLERLTDIEQRYEELTGELADPSVASDLARLRDVGKRHAELHEIVMAYRNYRDTLRAAEEAGTLAKEERDPEMIEYLRAEESAAETKAEELRARLEELLLPRDPNDERDVIVEIRAGTGGQEAALFAGDLLEMYRRYAERQGWKVEVLSSSPSELGGFKEVVLEVRGKGAYSKLKHESGGHRVQRIPVTESGGRIHTSTATVAVLPEAEEVDVEINPADLDIDVYHSSGPGGQSVNTTDSAVRITHRPSGIVVAVQEERSQRQNREKAMRYLRSRLLQRAQDEQRQQEAAARKAQVGSGDRSDRIRTYNFPQNRVTDHRINVSIHNLPSVVGEGNIDELVDQLLRAERTEQLTATGGEGDGQD